MSADNAIYIRPLKNGKFAVECISSLYIDQPHKWTDEEIDEVFENSEIVDSMEAAREVEKRLYEETFLIEYGTEILERRGN